MAAIAMAAFANDLNPAIDAHGRLIARLSSRACRRHGKDSASGHESTFDLVMHTSWDDPAERDRNVEWGRRVWRRVEAFTEGFYVNIANTEDGARRVRETYGENYDRLVSLKRKYDPTNLFRMNANINPLL
jgi:hypothetical protein